MKKGDKSLEGFVQVRPGVWHRDPPGDDPLHFTQVDVAAILKDRRKQVGMTMEQLAEKIGVNKSTISRLEAGQIEKLSSDKLAPIAEALRCLNLSSAPESLHTSAYICVIPHSYATSLPAALCIHLHISARIGIAIW